jgi:hypothetical protein
MPSLWWTVFDEFWERFPSLKWDAVLSRLNLLAESAWVVQYVVERNCSRIEEPRTSLHFALPPILRRCHRAFAISLSEHSEVRGWSILHSINIDVGADGSTKGRIGESACNSSSSISDRRNSKATVYSTVVESRGKSRSVTVPYAPTSFRLIVWQWENRERRLISAQRSLAMLSAFLNL